MTGDKVERDARLDPTRIPPPPFDPDYNLIRYRGLSNWAYWLVMAGFVAVIALAVVLSAVL